jgi:NAD(P)-dependent dehydrogenase (short-subunit alcohol dehydrogenase family)
MAAYAASKAALTAADRALTRELRAAGITINMLLATKAAEWHYNGFETLAEVPADDYDGTSALVHHYRNAVYSRAAALVLDRLRGYTTTRKGAEDVEARDQRADDLLAESHRAVRAILGQPGTVVELI